MRILYVTICFRLIPIFLFLHWHVLVRAPGAGYIKVSLQEEFSMYMTLTAEHIITPSVLYFPSCARAAECCRFVWNGIGGRGLMGNFPEGTELRKCDSLPSARRKKTAWVVLLSRNPPTTFWKTASSSSKTLDASAVAEKQMGRAVLTCFPPVFLFQSSNQYHVFMSLCFHLWNGSAGLWPCRITACLDLLCLLSRLQAANPCC